MTPNLSKVIDWDEFVKLHHGKIDEYTPLQLEARNYLEHFTWCKEVLSVYVGIVHKGIVGVFLFRILPSRQGVDEWIWVIVGDLPPAYLTCEDCPNPATAIDGYIGAMSDWVSAAMAGESVNGLIPVNVSANKENAENLKRRLDFLDKRILSQHSADLRE